MGKQKGLIEILIVLIIILAGFVIAGGFLTFKKTASNQSAVNLDTNPNNVSQKTLQLDTFKSAGPTTATQPTPLPTGECYHDTCKPVSDDCACKTFLIECRNKKCERLVKVAFPWASSFQTQNTVSQNGCDYFNGSYNYHSDFDKWCSQSCMTDAGGVYCIGKPVIYLYPQKDTLVNVKLNVPGEITESIPLYPNNGWQNILAHPNGSFEYLGKTYNELYFESAVNKVNPPKNGLVVEKKQLETELKTLTFKLGLVGKEQVEFLDYWLPKLNKLNYPYFFVSILESKEKERIDNVVINPTPDTKIEFLVYFKGLSKKIAVDPLIFPDSPPQRIGFTTVEWGGTIEE